MTHTLCLIGVEIRDPPRYDGLTDVEYSVIEFELQILALDVVLKVTPTRWWPTHKDIIDN